MKFPLLSFSLSSLIFLLVVGWFSYAIFKKSVQPQVAIELDVAMVGEVSKNKKSGQEKSEISGKEEKKSAQNSGQKSAQKLAPIFQPLPQIPDDLRLEAFNSKALARFYISANGEVLNVELIRPCANPRLNHLLLKSLKKWKFDETASSKAWQQDIEVWFKVE